MNREGVFFKASFEVFGENVDKFFRSSFIIVDEKNNKIIENIGNSSFCPKGIISKKTNPLLSLQESVKNVKVTVLKDGIVYDWDTTREDGSYFLALENGVYDFRLQGNSYNRLIKNVSISNGIKEYRQIVKNGQIKKRFFDSIEYVEFESPYMDDGKRLITGKIVDEHLKPVEDAEIIISKVLENNLSESRPIKVFFKTSKDGKYRFVLERENYDIIIRSPKHHAKVIKNFLFEPDKGFINKIKEDFLYFDQEGEWIWILN
jgi:hypothetical protein